MNPPPSASARKKSSIFRRFSSEWKWWLPVSEEHTSRICEKNVKKWAEFFSRFKADPTMSFQTLTAPFTPRLALACKATIQKDREKTTCQCSPYLVESQVFKSSGISIFNENCFFRQSLVDLFHPRKLRSYDMF